MNIIKNDKAVYYKSLEVSLNFIEKLKGGELKKVITNITNNLKLFEKNNSLLDTDEEALNDGIKFSSQNINKIIDDFVMNELVDDDFRVVSDSIENSNVDNYCRDNRVFEIKLTKLKNHIQKKLNNKPIINVEQNIKTVAKYFKFDASETKIFSLLLYNVAFGRIAKLLHNLSENLNYDIVSFISVACDIAPSKVVDILNNGKIRQLGLLVKDSYGSRGKFTNLSIGHNIERLVFSSKKINIKDVPSIIMGEPETTELEYDDFEHIKLHRDMALYILKGALKTKAKGINILLYGDTGVGKTEFCKVLAKEINASLYSVPSSKGNINVEIYDSQARLSSLRVFSNIISKSKEKAFILFDEMEDLMTFSNSFFARFSRMLGSTFDKKDYLNKILENTETPVIWTSNSIDNFDPSFLRRITLAIEIKPPTLKIRKNIWQRLIEKHNINNISDDIAEKLASEFSNAPALAVNAIEAFKVASTVNKDINGEDFIRECVKLSQKVINGGKELGNTIHKDKIFDPELSVANIDILKLSEQLTQSKNKNLSMLLYGPAGTGKTLYANYLAKELGLEALCYKASDLLSKYVGETEKGIAQAFATAREQGAVLILDEADSMLRDRGGALRSWEVTQVNEMLSCMENHNYPFICTTNFLDILDSASIRRFTFKIKFDYLTNDKSKLAFKKFFNVDAPYEISDLTLTASDFVNVKKIMQFMPNNINPNEILKLLEGEIINRKGVSRKVGFMVG